MGEDSEFVSLITKYHEAITKTDWPVRYRYSAVVSGGQRGTYTLALLYENLAGLVPPTKSFPEMLTEAFGAAEAQLLINRFSQCIESSSTTLAVYRPDLSHYPN